MKWHEYTYTWKYMSDMQGWKADRKLIIPRASYLLSKTMAGFEANNSVCLMQAEDRWMDAGRPYYDLYPSVAGAFTKIDLDKITCDQLHLPLPEMLIRMPVGKEYTLSPDSKLHSVLISEATGKAGRGWGISLDGGQLTSDGSTNHHINGLRMIPGVTIAEKLREGRLRESELPPELLIHRDTKVDNTAMDSVYKIIIAICLLKGNPDLIEPEPLEADREKWERTHDPKYIDKASRRGKRAWSVGKHIETAPGFRQPHFAIRWMQPQAGLTPSEKEVNRNHSRAHLQPVLRPIKGCLVKREAVTEVPTDWLDTAGQITTTEANHANT